MDPAIVVNIVLDVVTVIAVVIVGVILKQKLNAQAEILKKTNDFVTVMQRVIESTDEPKMLERLKAYKEFVEETTQATLKKQQAEFEIEKQQHEKHIVYDQRLLNMLASMTAGYMRTVANMMTYIPREKRIALIDDNSFPDAATKKWLYSLAEHAPDPPGRHFGVYELRLPGDPKQSAYSESRQK